MANTRTCLFFVISLALGFSSLSPSLFASDSQPDVEPWERAFGNGSLSWSARLGERFSDILFDTIDDLTLYKTSDDSFSASLSTSRRVFDNADVLNSWTVVDRFSVMGRIPFYTTELMSGAPTIGFWMGTELGLDFLNIRQVYSGDYPKLPSLENRTSEIESSSWYTEFQKIQNGDALSSPESKPDGRWVKRLDASGKESSSYLFDNPEENARYTKLWNLLAFPFRLPLKATSLDGLEDGEIIAYTARGQLEVGASVGWDLDPTNSVGVALGRFALKTFLTGDFRVAIQRESERFVKVKVSRGWGRGWSGSLNAEGRPSYLDGVIIIKNIQNAVKIIPFSLTVKDTFTNSFDVGYRFDMTKPEAREAYELAVTGRLARADELAVLPSGEAADFDSTGVRKIFTRDAETSANTQMSKLRLGFIWRNESGKSISNTQAVITMPDGTHHIFTSAVNAFSDWHVIWGSSERMEHSFTVNMDLDNYSKKGPEDAFNMIIEGRIADSDTSSSELRSYILEVEDSVAKPNIFPRMPIDGDTGRSNFYYRMGLTNSHLNKLVLYPEEQMWPALEKAFNVTEGTWSTWWGRFLYQAMTSPLSLLHLPLYAAGFNMEAGADLWHARTFKNQWEEIRGYRQPVERAEGVGKLFFDRVFSYQLVRLLRHVLDGNLISYYASGKSPVFGRVVDEGGSQLSFENIATRAYREIEFDRSGARVVDSDPSAIIQDLAISIVNEDRVELHFELQKAPLALFLQLRIQNWWWPFSSGGQTSLLVPNTTGYFQPGHNVIVFDRKDTGSALYAIARELALGNNYSVAIAVNNDNVHWGPVSTSEFTFTVDQPSRRRGSSR